MSDKIYMTSADSIRTIVYDLKLDDVATDLSGATVECHMKDRQSAVVVTSATVTPDADQVSNPGRISTEFTATELANVGTFTLEWEVTVGAQVVTYPGNAADRPVLTVRGEAA